FLIPQKSRLAVDIMNVADLDGNYIAGAQDIRPGDNLRPELVALAKAQAQQSWVLNDEPSGLVIRAIYVVRGADQQAVGFVEVGSVLGAAFLEGLTTKSDAEVALIWSGNVRASTFVDANGSAASIDGSRFPSVDTVDNAEGDTLAANVVM